uniref:Phage protein n=1 Tax=Strongyloides venezuelensis TaxID=75913 RepID=A0A0K0EYS1_STRVS
MAPARKTRANLENNGNLTSNFPKVLQDMQDSYAQQINKEKDKIKSRVPEVVMTATDIVYKAVIDNLPAELLDMKYGEFMNQMNGMSFSAGKPNDTLTVIEDLRNKVNNGDATPGEISKYRELKKLFK